MKPINSEFFFKVLKPTKLRKTTMPVILQGAVRSSAVKGMASQWWKRAQLI